MQELLAINPDEKDYLFEAPSSSLKEFEEKLLDKEVQKKIAETSLQETITLLARGIVKEQDQDEIFDLALNSMQEKYKEPYIYYSDQLIPHKTEKENREIFEAFKNEMQNPEKRRQFIENSRQNLQEFYEEEKVHIARYWNKATKTLQSINADIELPPIEGRVSFLTQTELSEYMKYTGLNHIYENGELGGLIVDHDKNSEYANAICLTTTKFEQDPHKGFTMKYGTNNTGIVDHELTHLIGNQMHNTRVYSVEDPKTGQTSPRTIIYSGFSPKVFKMDGSRDGREETRIKFGSVGFGDSMKYNLNHLEEAAAASMHALIETDGQVYDAIELLEKYRFAGFENPKYTAWALRLLNQVKLIGTKEFITAYCTGNYEGFRELALNKTGIKLEEVTN